MTSGKSCRPHLRASTFGSAMPDPLKILFVCGRNQWRSPTAERLYSRDTRVEVRSAGVSPGSRHEISGADLEWADLVLVMERRHAQRIREGFSATLDLPPIESLDIPDRNSARKPGQSAAQAGSSAVGRLEGAGPGCSASRWRGRHRRSCRHSSSGSRSVVPIVCGALRAGFACEEAVPKRVSAS